MTILSFINRQKFYVLKSNLLKFKTELSVGRCDNKNKNKSKVLTPQIFQGTLLLDSISPFRLRKF